MGSQVGDLADKTTAEIQSLGVAVGAAADRTTAGIQSLGVAAGAARSELGATGSQVGELASELGRLGSQIERLETQNYNENVSRRSFSNTAGKTPVSCAATGRVAVLVTLGQSNAANYGGGRYRAIGDVRNFNLSDGQCYRAADPLLGASGTGGNFATRLGDLLIARGAFDAVVLAPIAVADTTIEEWADGGEFNRRILVLIRRLDVAGLMPTHILWHQGEGNHWSAARFDISGRQYRKNLLEVVKTFRRYGIQAPFYVAQATLCGPGRQPSDHIRAGQRGAVNPLLGIYQGPDTDTLGSEWRDSVNCHFTEAGLARHAELWAETLGFPASRKTAEPRIEPNFDKSQ